MVIPGVTVPAFIIGLSVFTSQKLFYLGFRHALSSKLVMDPLVLSLDLLVVPHDYVKKCQPNCACEV